MEKYILKFNDWLGRIFKIKRNEMFYAFIGLSNQTDEEDEKDWLVREWQKKGFHSYIDTRHATITKEILLAIDRRDFQRATELNGQRLEIIKLKAVAKKEYELTQIENKKETVLKETGDLINKQISEDEEEEFYKL